MAKIVKHMSHRETAELFAQEVLEKGANFIVSVVLFGSVLMQTQTKKSDIDLLILTKNENESLMGIIQNAIDKYGQNIKLSLNVVNYADYMEHLAIGDPFSVLIAKRGLCLLNSTAFNAAKILVGNDSTIPDIDKLKSYLEQTIHNQTNDLLKVGIPKLQEDVRYIITYSLLLKELSQCSKVKWDDLLNMFSHKDDYISECNKIFPELSTLLQKSSTIEAYSLLEIKEILETFI